MNTLILNSNNSIGINKNIYRFNFTQGGVKIKENTKICLSSLTLPYSWFNISSFYGNNTFSITFPQTGSQPTYNITISDGFYTIDDLNYYLQQFMISNSLYLNNGSTKVFYISLTYNTTYYSVQAVLTPVPTTLPTGYTTPTGWRGFPTTAATPQLVVNNNGLGTYLGFNNGSYPTTVQSTSQSFLSSKIPVGSTVNSLTIKCNIVNNKLSFPSDVIDSVPINASFGSNITYTPSFEKFVACNPGVYNSLDITICDQNFNNISAKDNNSVITLILKED